MHTPSLTYPVSHHDHLACGGATWSHPQGDHVVWEKPGPGGHFHLGLSSVPCRVPTRLGKSAALEGRPQTGLPLPFPAQEGQVDPLILQPF